MTIAITRAGGLIIGNMINKEAAMAGDGLLFECSVGLYLAGPALTPNMVLGDFTPASFTGYAALTAQTWGTPYLDITNKLQLASPVQTFICTGAGDTQSVIGYYVWREGTPDVLLFADRFSEAIPITSIGDGVAFLITFELSLLDHGTYLFAP